MDELNDQLQSLLRFFVFSQEGGQCDRARLAEQFQQALELLIDEYGPEAVEAALDKLPEFSKPTGSVH